MTEELRSWTDTEAAHQRAKLGAVHYRTAAELAAESDTFVRLADEQCVARLGRHLNADEQDAARRQAQVAAGGFVTRTLDKRDYADLGWGFQVEAKPAGAGLAVSSGGHWQDGHWVRDYQGDPVIAQKAQAAEEFERQRKAQRDAGPVGGVAGAS